MFVAPVIAPLTLADPLKFWPQIVRVFWRVVAVDALPVTLPVNEAVIVPAEKLPDPSL